MIINYYRILCVRFHEVAKDSFILEQNFYRNRISTRTKTKSLAINH